MNIGMQAVLHIGGEPIGGGHLREVKKSHWEILAELVESLPGLTSAEYSRQLKDKKLGNNRGERRSEAGRRLSELVRDGRLREGCKRKCSVSNKRCKTWRHFDFKETVSGGAAA